MEKYFAMSREEEGLAWCVDGEPRHLETLHCWRRLKCKYPLLALAARGAHLFGERDCP